MAPYEAPAALHKAPAALREAPAASRATAVASREASQLHARPSRLNTRPLWPCARYPWLRSQLRNTQLGAIALLACRFDNVSMSFSCQNKKYYPFILIGDENIWIIKKNFY